MHSQSSICRKDRIAGERFKWPLGQSVVKCLICVFSVMVLVSGLCPSLGHARRYALLVGVADYQHLPAVSKDGKCDLKGPLNDVELLFDALTSRYCFQPQNIEVLVDQQAICQNIIASFNRRLFSGGRPGDLVVFYFAGHGSQVPDNDGDENDGLPGNVKCNGI